MRSRFFPSGAAFTLVELLIVIAVIGVMASMVIAAFSNAAQDTRGVVALQQQAVLQEAVNNWVARQSSGSGSILSARTTYNATTNKFDLIVAYLDPTTVANFDTSNPAQIRSEVLTKTGQYISFAAWASNSYPKVQLNSVTP